MRKEQLLFCIAMHRKYDTVVGITLATRIVSMAR